MDAAMDPELTSMTTDAELAASLQAAYWDTFDANYPVASSPLRES